MVNIRRSRASSSCKNMSHLHLCKGPFCSRTPGPGVLLRAFLSGSLPCHVLRTISLAPLLPKRAARLRLDSDSRAPSHAAHSLYWKLLEQMDYLQIFVKKSIIHILWPYNSTPGNQRMFYTISTKPSHNNSQCRLARWGWEDQTRAQWFPKDRTALKGITRQFNKGYLQSVCNYRECRYYNAKWRKIQDTISMISTAKDVSVAYQDPLSCGKWLHGWGTWKTLS